MLSRFFTNNKVFQNKQIFNRFFSGFSLPILDEIKKESKSLHSLFSEVATGDKYLSNKQYSNALSSYSIAKDIFMKYTNQNNFQSQAILRKMIACCDQSDSTHITDFFEDLLKITPLDDKYLAVYLLNYINYGYYLADINDYKNLSKLINNHSIPSEINKKSELLPFHYHFENIKGIMNYQQDNKYHNKIDRNEVNDKLWKLRFKRNEEVMNCDSKELNEISEEYYKIYEESNKDVNLIEEIMLYHYSYLNIILQNQTSDKNKLREFQHISLKCLGIVDNTPFEFSRYVSGLLCEIAKIAHMQEQAVSSEGLYKKAMEILDSVPRIDNNIYWDIYGNCKVGLGMLYKDWMNREKNGEKLVKDGFDLLQLHNVNETNRFYKKNWYEWDL